MSRRILLVDDDADIREIARVSLELGAGWEIVEAADGATAEDIAQRERFDLILLDYMMPGQDGLTTLKHLKADPRTAAIPVVVLTAKTQAGLEATVREAGALGVIPKPFDPLVLDALIRSCAGWSA